MSDLATAEQLRNRSRSRRKREVRARTVSSKRTPKRELELLRVRADIDLQAAGDFFSPVTRGDCENVARPCPHISCKHHLYIDVSPATGALKYNFPDIEPDDLPSDGSCALDCADLGGMTLERVAEVMNLTRERVRQIESAALAKVGPGLALHADERGLDVTDPDDECAAPREVPAQDGDIADLFDVGFEAAVSLGRGGWSCP